MNVVEINDPESNHIIYLDENITEVHQFSADIEATWSLKGGEDISKLIQINDDINDEDNNEKIAEPKFKLEKKVEDSKLSLSDVSKEVEIITMPRLSDTMEEGRVAKWFKKVGDSVKEGDILAEIETDKATMEFESFYSGTLLHIGIKEGESSPVESTLAIIGDNTVIRECATVNRATKVTGKTIVGNNCLIMAYAHIAHDCVIGDNSIIVNNVALGGHVDIGEYAIVGGLTAVHQFVKIGRQSLIGGGFSAKQDVPPFIIGAGIPLRFVGINKIGLERRKFSEDVRALIKKTYRTYFKSKLNRGDALKKIKNEISQIDEVKEIVSFIESSSRGII